MTEQTPEVTEPPVTVVVNDEKAPSRFKVFRTTHPRLMTVVYTLTGVAAASAVVKVVKSAKDDDSLALGTDAEEMYLVDPQSAGTDAPKA